MADRYTFDQALREAQDSLSGDGIVSVEDEGGSIVVRVTDPGAGRRLVADHDGAYRGWPLKAVRASATAILTVVREDGPKTVESRTVYRSPKKNPAPKARGLSANQSLRATGSA